MAKVLRQLNFKLPEAAEMLLKQQGIKSGHWSFSVTFGFNAGSMPGEFEGQKGIFPTAVLPVMRVGLKEEKEPTEHTIDASSLYGVGSKRPTTKKKAAKKR